MASEKSLAIVLRVTDFSESSSIVTLFSRDFGKLGALAKGAKRPKGPFESALDLLAVCRIVFIHKSSASLDLLTEAKLERRFRAAGRDLNRLYAGYYVIELLDLFTDLGDPHPQLFDEAVHAIVQLDGTGRIESTVLRYELVLLSQLGHLPTWQQCAHCGQPVRGEMAVSFGLLAGGVLCEVCRRGQRMVVRLGSPAWTVLKRFSQENLHELPELESGVQPYGEVRGLMNQYLCHLLGRRPRMHELAPTWNLKR